MFKIGYVHDHAHVHVDVHVIVVVNVDVDGFKSPQPHWNRVRHE
ncbi:MAG TPA: hypothetical protein VGQ81_12240 [Acidobacteriota bacterium]|jgi:hypothetical protein|nr:hypothetical protein [Acidobacteriota bacterium]